MHSDPRKPVYTSEDLAGFDPARELGFPGEFPFTAASSPPCTGDTCGRCASTPAWATRRRATPATNFFWQTVCQLSVAFDLPTQIGYELRRPDGIGGVGKVGVAIDSLEDMERLFAGNSSGQDLDLDDHQCHGIDPAGAVCVCGPSLGG